MRVNFHLSFYLLLAVLLASLPPQANPLTINSATAEATLPIMMATVDDKANVRSGPSLYHPILWTFEKSRIPVKAISEYEQWYKIVDWRGQEGWVFHSLLGRRKTFIVTVQRTELYIEPHAQSSLVAYLGKDYVGEIFQCYNNFCQVKLNDDGGKIYSGWLRRKDIWGACTEADILAQCRQ